MAKKREREVNLTEKFDSLINARPNFFDDEEDENLVKIDDIAPKERNSDCSADELDLVQFRKLNIEFLDADDSKYSGKKSSRVELSKAFASDSSDVEDSSDENVEHSHGTRDLDYVSEHSQEDEAVTSDHVESDGEFETQETITKVNPVLDADIIQKSSEDVKKGNAIRNQLLIWDLLLECRMKFQKCLVSSNQLPKFDNLKKFTSQGGLEFEGVLKDSQKSLEHLLNSFLKLQDVLLRKSDDYQRFTSKHKISSDDDEQGEENVDEKTQCKKLKLEDFSNEIEGRHKKMETFRNQTIQKWNDKTRIAHMNSKNFNAFEQSTLKQIEHVLLDKQRLIKRTQVKRSNYHILGQSDDESPPKKQIKMDNADNVSESHEMKKEEKKIHKEIFDDDDFYHQLLSEYIKRKSCDVSDPISLGKQWIQLEKIRSKMKKKVDSRATKGRKIRYVVHPKLVNFMMPIDNVIYNEGSRLELFNSIFGRNQKL